MKAKTQKTRWLLLALSLGILTTGAWLLTRHHGDRIIAKANVVPAPVRTALRQAHTALLAAVGDHRPHRVFAGRYRDEASTDEYSNNDQPADSSRSGPIVRTGWSNDATTPIGGPPAQNGHSATSPAGQPPSGWGEFAYNGYVPQDCELPAGCGNSGGTQLVSRQPSGTSGGVPSPHDSQGSGNGTGGSQTDNGTNPPPGDTHSGQGSDPPGQSDPPPSQGSQPVASAPELDPATLGAAITLLLGSLAILRSRRVRATR